jgi:hypothetical protein
MRVAKLAKHCFHSFPHAALRAWLAWWWWESAGQCGRTPVCIQQQHDILPSSYEGHGVQHTSFPFFAFYTFSHSARVSGQTHADTVACGWVSSAHSLPLVAMSAGWGRLPLPGQPALVSSAGGPFGATTQGRGRRAGSSVAVQRPVRGLPRHERICKVCNVADAVVDVRHFLLECPAYG